MERKESLCRPPEYTADMIGDMYKEEVARALRLSTIFDILGDDYDLERLRELVEADREGRVRIHARPNDHTCGSCVHFRRITGRCCGTCTIQSRYRDKYGREDDRRGTFTPSQSRKACRWYEKNVGEET